MSVWNNSYVGGFVGSLILLALTSLGGWLSVTFVPDEVTLSYNTTSEKVGDVQIFHFVLENDSKFAFNKVTIKKPEIDPLISSFKPTTLKNSAANIWTGAIAKNEYVAGVYIFNNETRIYSDEEWMESLESQYLAPHDQSGVLEPKSAFLVKASAFDIPKLFWKGLLFMSPIILGGLLLFGGYALIIKIRGQE